MIPCSIWLLRHRQRQRRSMRKGESRDLLDDRPRELCDFCDCSILNRSCRMLHQPGKGERYSWQRNRWRRRRRLGHWRSRKIGTRGRQGRQGHEVARCGPEVPLMYRRPPLVKASCWRAG